MECLYLGSISFLRGLVKRNIVRSLFKLICGGSSKNLSVLPSFHSNQLFLPKLYFSTRFYIPKCVFSLLLFFSTTLSFVCKFLTSKVVTGVFSYFKSNRVCSLSKIVLLQKSTWFTSSSIWWFLGPPIEQEFIKFLFHLPPNLVIYWVALTL